MSKRSYERRLAAKRAAQKAQRHRAARMRKWRIGGSIAGAVAVAGVVLIAVLAGGDERKPLTSSTPTPTPTGTVAGCTTPNPAPTPNGKQYPSAPARSIDTNRIYVATVTTNCGSFKIRMDPQVAPTTVNNIVFLARQGFYNGVVFHRIEDNPGSYAIIQGGDPKGDGTGGPGYDYDGETPPSNAKYTRGIVAMAKPQAAFQGQPPQNGSQFFVVVRDWPDLPPEYTVFGQIIDETASFEVLNRIVSAKSAGGSTPRVPIYMLSVTISELARS